MLQENRFYHGSSMLGTFRPGDYLWIEKIAIDDARRGDIVVFQQTNPKGEKEDLVHRIINKTAVGLVSSGDNNPVRDPEPVTRENFVGRVTHFSREHQVHKIFGGQWGLLRSRYRHTLISLKRMGKRILGHPYRWIRRSEIIKKIWHPTIRELHFLTPKGPLIKYIHENRTIGWHWTRGGCFRCRKPFDLVLIPLLVTRPEPETTSKEAPDSDRSG